MYCEGLDEEAEAEEREEDADDNYEEAEDQELDDVGDDGGGDSDQGDDPDGNAFENDGDLAEEMAEDEEEESSGGGDSDDDSGSGQQGAGNNDYQEDGYDDGMNDDQDYANFGEDAEQMGDGGLDDYEMELDDADAEYEIDYPGLDMPIEDTNNLL